MSTVALLRSDIISISKLLGNYNKTRDIMQSATIISISKLLGNYNNGLEH